MRVLAVQRRTSQLQNKKKTKIEKFTRRTIPDNFIKKLKTNSGFAAYLTGELSTHKRNAKKTASDVALRIVPNKETTILFHLPHHFHDSRQENAIFRQNQTRKKSL